MGMDKGYEKISKENNTATIYFDSFLFTKKRISNKINIRIGIHMQNTFIFRWVKCQ